MGRRFGWMLGAAALAPACARPPVEPAVDAVRGAPTALLAVAPERRAWDTWNLWMEPRAGSASEPAREPVDAIRPGRRYDVWVALSREPLFAGVQSTGVSEAADEALAAGGCLDLVLVPDPNVFVQTEIQTRRLCGNGTRTDVWGATGFGLTARSRPRTSLATVAVSVWDGERPVDELELAVPVHTAGPLAADARGMRSLVLHPTDRAVDAAIHFVPRDVDTVGVMRMGDRWWSWTVALPLDDRCATLADWLGTCVGARYADAVATDDRDAMRAIGLELAEGLFPPGTQGREALEALGERDDAPTLFVRALDDGMAPVPLGLVWTGDGHLGFDWRVETPLPRQTYGQTRCVDDWFVAAPQETSDPALAALRAEATSLDDGVWTRPGVTAIRDVPALDAFLRDATPREPLALLFAGHHHDERGGSVLHFGGEAQVWSLDLGEGPRVAPSLAVLDACGTDGAPAGASMLRVLNDAGFATMFVTRAEVPPDLAGDFVNCLDRELARAETERPAGIEASLLLHRTVRCLADEAPGSADALPPGVEPADEDRYGPLALAYFLAGDGGAPVCAPSESE